MARLAESRSRCWSMCAWRCWQWSSCPSSSLARCCACSHSTCFAGGHLQLPAQSGATEGSPDNLSAAAEQRTLLHFYISAISLLSNSHCAFSALSLRCALLQILQAVLSVCLVTPSLLQATQPLP